MRIIAISLFVAALFMGVGSPTHAEELKPAGIGAKPPREAVILFNGADTAAWRHANSEGPIQWQIVDGSLEAKPRSGSIRSRQQFGDCILHVEFNLPLMPEATSQGRANSGVYLQGRYEIQVLDSYRNPTYATGGVGAIYGQKDPDQDAIRAPGVWQSFDIHFTAGKLDASGAAVTRPRITVFHNGILIHKDVELKETETLRNVGGRVAMLGPVLLQDHGNRVRYRNIWILPKRSTVEAVSSGIPEPSAGNWD